MTNDELWKRVKSDLEVTVSKPLFNLWIKPTELKSINETPQGNMAEVVSTSPYHVFMLQSKFKDKITEAIFRVSKMSCEIQFVIGSKEPKPPQKTEEVAQPTLSQPQKAEVPQQLFEEHQSQTVSPVTMALRQAGLRDDYTFETFAVSSSNEMAHAAAIAVSQSPGRAYNPLFLYGGVGVGKTHLMQAVAINILRQDPSTPLAYITGEEFTNSIVSAIQEKKTIQLKNRLRKYKVLLVDDIQFIAGKESVQEEFFHTFNAIAPSGGQIILTSDRPPQDISPLEDRLRSRFEAGLIIDIQQPTFELRTAITLIKAKKIGLPLPMDLAQKIATVVDNARKIEGILAKLHSEHFLFKKPLSPELVDSIIGAPSEITEKKITTKPSEVVKTVCNFFHVSPKNLKGPSRIKQLVIPRHIAMYLMYEHAEITLEDIGNMFNGRDHSSVIHAVEKIKTSLLEDEDLRKVVQEVHSKLEK